jgi:hypothetical protein
MKIGLTIVLLMAVGYSAIEIQGVFDHVGKSEWPPHANFHAMTGLLNLLTLFTITIILMWRYVDHGDRLAWWIVTLVGIGIFGGAVAADSLTRGGLREGETALVSGTVAYWSGWLGLVSWLVAMILVRSRVTRKSD